MIPKESLQDHVKQTKVIISPPSVGKKNQAVLMFYLLVIIQINISSLFFVNMTYYFIFMDLFLRLQNELW